MTYWLKTVIVTGIMLVPFSGQFGLSTIIFIKHFRNKDICQSARYQLVGKLKSSQIYWTGIIFPGLRWKVRNCGRFFPQPPRWLQVMTWCWCQHGSYPPKLRKSTKAYSCTQNVPRIPISSAICSPAWVFILVINRAPCIQWIWYKYINHVRFLLTQTWEGRVKDRKVGVGWNRRREQGNEAYPLRTDVGGVGADIKKSLLGLDSRAGTKKVGFREGGHDTHTDTQTYIYI